MPQRLPPGIHDYPCLKWPITPSIDFWSDRERMSFRSYSICAAVVNVNLLPACPHGMGKGGFLGTVALAHSILPVARSYISSAFLPL